MTIEEFSNDLTRQLIKAGFIVLRYDALSTDSVYLKLDYGVCNSIRISDHEGKVHLKYRYNIGPHIKKRKAEMDVFPRYYYPMWDVAALMKQILSDRAGKLKHYGHTRYEKFMKENQKAHKGSKGFWSDARQVFI